MNKIRLKLFLPAVLSAVLAALLAACVSKPEITEENNTAGTQWNISNTVQELGGDDPIEPFNRCMFEVTDFVMYYLINPISRVYCSILPGEVIQRIDNVSDNLAFPGRMVSCLLQAKWKAAGISVSRFLVNSTLGLAGAFDPAGYYWGLARRPENMGQAFASWGIGPGCYLFLPFSSATNVRDQIGMAFDSLLDIKIILPYAGYVSAANHVMNSYDSYNNFMESIDDRYDLFKSGMSAIRYSEIHDTRDHLLIPEDFSYMNVIHEPKIDSNLVRIAWYFDPDNPLVDTLRNAMFQPQRSGSRWWKKTSFWNRDFENLAENRYVRHNEESGRVYYRFWDVPEKEDGKEDITENTEKELVILIPGVGGHYTGKNLTAFAERFSEAGYAVAAVSSPMNWAFANTADTAFPGYQPDDTQHLREYLRKVLDDLAQNCDFQPSRIVIAGYSLGGMETLMLAEMESRQNTLGASRYIAINPPADLLYAAGRFDTFATVTRSWTRQQYFDALGDAIVKYAPAAQKRYPFQPVPDMAVYPEMDKPEPETPEYYYKVRVSPEQAAAMFAISFSMTQRELVMAALRNGFLKDPNLEYRWSRRVPLYAKIDAMSAGDYVMNFLKPQHPELTRDQMAFNSSLYSIKDFLAKSPDVRVIHTLDDPLLSQKDVDFLCDTFGDRILWFDCGGHMGYLYTIIFHAALLNCADPESGSTIMFAETEK